MEKAENDRLAAEFEAKIDAKVSENAELKAVAAKRFDPREVLLHARDIREVVDVDSGVVRFVHLCFRDLNEVVEEYPDNKERSIQILFRQLSPAYPANGESAGLSLKDIRDMPYEVVVKLLTLLGTEGRFFPQARSPIGSEQTLPRSK